MAPDDTSLIRRRRFSEVRCGLGTRAPPHTARREHHLQGHRPWERPHRTAAATALPPPDCCPPVGAVCPPPAGHRPASRLIRRPEAAARRSAHLARLAGLPRCRQAHPAALLAGLRLSALPTLPDCPLCPPVWAPPACAPVCPCCHAGRLACCLKRRLPAARCSSHAGPAAGLCRLSPCWPLSESSALSQLSDPGPPLGRSPESRAAARRLPARSLVVRTPANPGDMPAGAATPPALPAGAFQPAQHPLERAFERPAACAQLRRHRVQRLAVSCPAHRRLPFPGGQGRRPLRWQRVTQAAPPARIRRRLLHSLCHAANPRDPKSTFGTRLAGDRS